VTFVLRDGTRRTLAVVAGQSLLAIAWAHDLGIEGACEGEMACSTCHVLVARAWTDRLKPPSPEEDDLLDLVPGATDASRLGCQIVMTDALDGLEVTLPQQARSLLP